MGVLHHWRKERLGRFTLALAATLILGTGSTAIVARAAETPIQAAVGTISGYVFDESGSPTELGRVDLFDETGVFLGSFDTDVTGRYVTTALEPGVYFLILYNGDDEFYYDYFPQWYGGATLLRPDRADPVSVTTGNVTNINARLLPGYEDMYDSVFIQSIAWMQYTGITQGCAPALYCVDDPVTRGQMAAFLVRALGYSDDGGGDLFDDDDGSVFEAAIDRLGTAGVTTGCNPPDNTSFCPDDLVTRGQMAAFLVRAMGYVDNGGGDLFDDDDDSVFEGAIDRLGTAGVTLGCNPPTNSLFCPGDLVTRGQMAAFLHRALKEYYVFSVDPAPFLPPPRRLSS